MSIAVKLCECGCGGRTTIAPQTDSRQGYVKGQPRRFVNGHHFRKFAPPGWTENEGGCWIWDGYHHHPGGYGLMWNGVRQVRAHRYIYEQRVGLIPDGLVLDHLCRTPACVNPDHLEPITQVENARRAFRADHAAISYLKSDLFRERFGEAASDEVRQMLRHLRNQPYSERS